MSTRIHPTAIVEPGAELAEDVEVGAYTLIGAGVQIGAGSSIGPHCVIRGLTQIGAGNRVFQFCSLGEVPQDKKYAGEPTRLVIGDRNTIREFCTFNCGTVQDGGVTRIGSDNWIMAYVHVAHDCAVGDQVIIANSTQLAGHVSIGDHAIGGQRGAAGHRAVRDGRRQPSRTQGHQWRGLAPPRLRRRDRTGGKACLPHPLPGRTAA